MARQYSSLLGIDDFETFVSESNRIEGIRRDPDPGELYAHLELMDEPALTVAAIERFVLEVAGKPLRREPYMNVRVGAHLPPPGGKHIEPALSALLTEANSGADPYEVHHAYEALHPFLDGNGRSGRAVWLWQMLRQQNALHALRMGFLHLFYYQTLASRNRANPAENGAGSSETRSGSEDVIPEDELLDPLPPIAGLREEKP